MPTVPRLTGPQVDLAPVNRPLLRAIPDAAPTAIGQGVDAVSQAIARQRGEETRAQIISADTSLAHTENALLFDPEKGALNLQGKNAMGLVNQVMPAYDKAAQAQEDALQNPRAKQLFRQSYQERRNAIEKTLDEHEAGQRKVYFDNEDQAAVDASVTAAANYWNNPSRVGSELGRQQTLIQQRGARNGWSNEQTQAAIDKYAGATHESVIAQMLENKQTGTAQNYLAANEATIKPEDRARISKAIEAGVVDDTADGLRAAFEKGGPEAGNAALARATKGMSLDMQGRVTDKVNASLSQIRTQAQITHAKDLAGIYKDIEGDSTDPSVQQRIDQMWRSNVLTPVEYASLSGRADNARVKGAGKQAVIGEVLNSLNTGFPLDPNNKQHRDGLNLVFNSQAKGSDVGSQEWQNLASAYATKTRLVPEAAIAWTRQSLRSPNPQVAAKAAGFMGSLEATAPDAVSGFDGPTKAFASALNTMVQAGTDPKQAVEIARKNIFETTPAIQDQRKKEFREGDKAVGKTTDSSLDNFIDRDFDHSWFSSQPSADSGIKSDFRSLTEQYYNLTGNADNAKDLAWKDIKRVYGVSEVNGSKQMMPFPPERFGVSAADMQKTISDAYGKDSGVTVVPDALTMRMVSSLANGEPVQPSYQLVDKQGMPVVDERGIRKRYVLPGGHELADKLKKAQADAEAAAQKAVADAKQIRADHAQQFQLNQSMGGVPQL